MSKFYDSQLFFWVVVIAILAYVVYYLFETIKFLLKNIKERKAYLEKNKDAKSINHYWSWLVAYGVLVLYSISQVILIDETMEQSEWFRIAFFFVGMMLFGQILISIVKRRILIGKDGFVYEDSFVRWQSVLKMEPKKKGIMKVVDLLTTNNKHYTLPPSLGKILHDDYEAYRAEKKNAKKGK